MLNKNTKTCAHLFQFLRLRHPSASINQMESHKTGTAVRLRKDQSAKKTGILASAP